jgi:hypothetical protein
MWIKSAEEFTKECVNNRIRENEGKRSVWFNGNRVNPQTGAKQEYCCERFSKYIAGVDYAGTAQPFG